MFKDFLDWVKGNFEPVSVLQTGSPLSAALRLLKAVASFPSSIKDTKLQLHTDGWEKRVLYMQCVVELTARASQSRHTHSISYSDTVDYLLQLLVDVAVYEPQSQVTAQFYQLVQDFLHLYNTTSSTPQFQEKLQTHLFDSLQQMPNAHMLTIPFISAGSHILMVVSTMVNIIEHTIAVYFSLLQAPDVNSIPLPYSDTMYGWRPVTDALSVPVTKLDDFVQWCINRCAPLSLHAVLLQMLSRCTSIEQEYSIACKVVDWCTLMKPIPQEESRVFLIWEKAISLLVRQVKFSGKVTNIPTKLSNLASLLQRFGEDKASDGLLGVIGLGKKSVYSLQFRLISRALSTYIYCQAPLDTNQTTILRVAPGSAGHIKDPFRNQPGYVSAAIPLKQADQTYNNFEALMNNKNYASLKDKSSYALGFICDLNHTIVNTVELLVYLSVWLYSEDRYLDTLRVLLV